MVLVPTIGRMFTILRMTVLILVLVGSQSFSITGRSAWQELSIEKRTTTSLCSHDESSSIGKRLKKGESILKLYDVASPNECNHLTASCLEASKKQSVLMSFNNPGLARLPTIAAYERMQSTNSPCSEPLFKEIDGLLQEVLKRVISSIDEQIPSIVTTLFHDKPLSEQFELDRLEYSPREPAINVYTEGGGFRAHKDKQALTVLLPLSNDGIDFEGGGTAFWSQDARRHGVEEPCLMVKPRAGTAMLFGGCVTHAGMPVTKGTRVVFVASFSPKDYESTI